MKRPWIVTIVVSTLAMIALIYAGTLSICAFYGIEPPEKVLDYLKDAGIYALGGLTGLLVKTSEVPEETRIVNTPDQAVPIKEQE
jgi:hypothetical protein